MAKHAEIRSRVETICQILMDGGDTPEVMAVATQEKWGVGYNTLRRYINIADKALRSRAALNMQNEWSRVYRRLSRIAREAHKKEDIKAEIQALRMQAEMAGMFPSRFAKKVEAIPKQFEELPESEKRQLEQDFDRWQPPPLQIEA